MLMRWTKKLTLQAKTRYIKVLYFCFQNALKLTYTYICDLKNFPGGYTPDPRSKGRGEEKGWEKGWKERGG